MAGPPVERVQCPPDKQTNPSHNNGPPQTGVYQHVKLTEESNLAPTNNQTHKQTNKERTDRNCRTTGLTNNHCSRAAAKGELVGDLSQYALKQTKNKQQQSSPNSTHNRQRRQDETAWRTKWERPPKQSKPQEKTVDKTAKHQRNTGLNKGRTQLLGKRNQRAARHRTERAGRTRRNKSQTRSRSNRTYRTARHNWPNLNKTRRSSNSTGRSSIGTSRTIRRNRITGRRKTRRRQISEIKARAKQELWDVNIN